MKRLRMGLLTFALIIVLASTCQATAPKIDFQYNSLIGGVHNPDNSGMTDVEWRAYYTNQFSIVYTDKYISSRPYDWYRTQKETNLANNNCGAACLSMALEWYDVTQDKSVNAIRDEIGGSRGVLNTQIDSYLTAHYVPHNIGKASTDSLYSTLKQNGIVIAIIKWRGTEYHSIIINGVYTFKGKQYFMYYNPAGNTDEYSVREVDIEYLNQHNLYSTISADDLSKELYPDWSAEILPK